MKNAVEKIVRSLVGSPDLVEVYEDGEGGKTVKFSVHVAPRSFGGADRQGKAARSKRSAAFSILPARSRGDDFIWILSRIKAQTSGLIAAL